MQLPSQKNPLTNPAIIKPLLTGAFAFAIDTYFFGNTDTMQALTFGGGVALGVASAKYITPNVMSVVQLESTSYYNGMTLEMRIIELVSGAGASYALNKYVLKNDPYFFVVNKLATIVVADVAATFLTEYLNKEPLHYI